MREQSPNWIFIQPDIFNKISRMALAILGIGLLFLSTQSAYGQSTNDPVVEKISKEILQLIRKNLNDQPTSGQSGDLETADRLFNSTAPNLDLTNHDQIYHHQIKKLKKDIGLNLKAQHFINHDQSFDAEDGADSNLSGSRTRVGVEWNILREGWLGHQQKARQLEKKRQLDNLKFALDNNDNKLYYRFNLMIYLFNQEKIRLLTHREAQLIEQQKLLYQVYFLKGILYEDIIKVKSQIEQVNVQLKNYKDYNDWFESTLGNSGLDTDFAVQELPVLHLNLDYLIHENTKDVLLDSIQKLEEDIAFGADRGINDISLKVQGYRNMNQYKNELRDTRNFNSIGVGLSIPFELLFNKKNKNDLAYAQIKNRKSFNNYEALNTSTEIINYHYEYNYKMKTYMEFLHKEMLYREKIRVETVNQKNYKDIYRSLRILNHLDVMRNIQTEMLDLKQQMYLLLLKIYGKTPYQTIQNFVRPINVEDFYQRLPAERLMALSEADLKNNQPDFIRNYLTTNGIRRIILAKGLDGNHPDVIGLKSALSGKKIHLARKFDGQTLLASQNPSGLLSYAFTAKHFDGVVLDFSNYQESNQRNQAQRFLIDQFDLFSQPKAKGAETVRFHIQLAPGYPIEFLNVLAKTTDLLTFKINHPKDLAYFENLNQNGFTGMKKVGVDLGQTNFRDRVEMEAYIDMLKNVYQINFVTINGLNEFLKIDTQTILQQEKK